MTSNIRTATGVGVILAAALCAGYVGFRAARSAERFRDVVAKKRAALDAEIHELEAAIVAHGREPGEPEASRKESPWHVAADDGSSVTSPNKEGAVAPNPRIFAFPLMLLKERVARSYGPFFQATHLTPAQIAAFENLMAAHEETIAALKTVAATDALNDSGPEITELKQEEKGNLHAGEIALLGDAGYQQLQQFSRVLPVQSLINQVGANSGFPPEPLTGAQGWQLTAVLANASSGYQNGGSADLATVDWNTVLAQAQGFLSTAQFDELKASICNIEVMQFRKQFFQREQGLK